MFKLPTQDQLITGLFFIMIIWKPILGFEDYYHVSNQGDIKSLRRNKNLAIKLTSSNYGRVSLVVNGKETPFRVHRLVAQAFIPNPENKKEVHHKNGIRLDNRVENLQWCSREENIRFINRKPNLKLEIIKIINENPNIKSVEDLIRYLS